MNSKFLNLSRANKEENFNPHLLKHWSQHLSIYLDKSPSEIHCHLLNYYTAYQSNIVEDLLNAANQFTILPGDPFLRGKKFHNHINYINRQLDLSVERELPKIPFIAFHKTASSYISVVFCHLLNVTPTILSYRHKIGVPAWVRAFAKWGGVTHDHYFPSNENLNLLTEAGITKCIIHARHPIHTLVSYAFHAIDNNHEFHNHQKDRLSLVRTYIEQEMENILSYYGNWLRLWQQAAHEKRFNILFTDYDDMKKNKLAFFKRMANFYNLNDYDADLENILKNLSPKKNNKNFNFRKGTSNEWRDLLSKEQADKLLDCIQKNIPKENNLMHDF